MTKHAPRALAAMVVAGLISCAHGIQHTGAASSASEGVRVTLASGRCYVNRSTEQFPTAINDARTRVDLKLEMVNDAAAPVDVTLDRLRLADEAHGETVAPRQSGRVSLAPGETRIVALAFEADGRRGCRRSLALASDGAVTLSGQDLDLDPIPFEARR
jgi:hypothetical protein